MIIRFNELQAVCMYNLSHIDAYKDRPCTFNGPTVNQKCQEKCCPLNEEEK